MAISRVGFSSAEATTIALPGSPQAGDLMIIFAFRDGSVTNPTIPTGWTSITNTLDGTLCSVSAGWRRYVSGDTSGTWTNTTGLICAIYRGTATNKTPVAFNAQSSSGATNTVTYAALSATTPKSANQWIVSFAGHVNIDTTIQTAPGVLVNQTNTVGATAEYAGHDSNGVLANFLSTNVTITGTAGAWITMNLVILAEEGFSNNYQQFKVPNGMSTSEKIR